MSSRAPRVWAGLPFGAAVWATGYVVLPRLGVYEEIWNYDLETLAKDLSAHLAFGTATAAAFRLLRPGGRQPVSEPPFPPHKEIAVSTINVSTDSAATAKRAHPTST